MSHIEPGSMASTHSWYSSIKKPSWAPPAWLFGPVWTALYVLIAVSYGRVTYLTVTHELPLVVLLPFALNLFFNIIYSPIQFRLKNYTLATCDIVLILGTLVWAFIAVYPYVPWVVYINIPYLLWVSFATILQVTITLRNS